MSGVISRKEKTTYQEHQMIEKIIEDINDLIENIDEDYPLLDFNSRYMMERGMRMALIQIKKRSTDFQTAERI